MREIAAERGQDTASVVAEAVALLDAVMDVTEAEVAEDRRRLDAFNSTREAVPLEDVKAWTASWDGPDEAPRPQARRME